MFCYVWLIMFVVAVWLLLLVYAGFWFGCYCCCGFVGFLLYVLLFILWLVNMLFFAVCFFI